MKRFRWHLIALAAIVCFGLAPMVPVALASILATAEAAGWTRAARIRVSCSATILESFSMLWESWDGSGSRPSPSLLFCCFRGRFGWLGLCFGAERWANPAEGQAETSAFVGEC